MRTEHPPAIATWLLKHFGCSPKNEQIIGDLVERYQEGPSRLWYWRQVLRAIAAGFSLQIISHKWLALRSVSVGWSVLLAYLLLLSRPLFGLLAGLSSWSRWWRYGWIRPLIFILSLTVFSMISGWAVARCNRAHRRMTVLIYAFSLIFLISVYWVVWIFALPHQLAVGHIVWTQNLLALADNILAIIAVLFGGGLLSNRSVTHSRTLKHPA